MNLRQPSISIPLAAALVLLTAAVAGCRRHEPIPDRAEAVGAFEIVTHSTRDAGRSSRGRGVTERYSVRWRGEELAFAGAAGMFGARAETYRTVNAAITFPAPEPAFVVNVGDPEGSSFFYLVREVDGKPKAEPLGPDSGFATAVWIDPPPDDTSMERFRAIRRRHMKGGTLLLLGEWTVLDTRTLRSHQLGRREGAHPRPFHVPNALSPDRRSFARLAFGPPPEYAPLLLVHAFTAGVSYVLPIDRRVLRVNDLQEIDRGWVEHHFQWRSVDGGPERLLPREGVAPLPYHVDRAMGDEDPSFMIFPVKAEMKDTLVAFLQREMGAAVLGGGRPATSGWSPSTSLRIGEETVHVKFLLPEDTGGDGYVHVSPDFRRPSRITERIADRFDAELRTGRHDALFTP
jgi:hypothetical protein